jgi:hypothetical protein
VGTVGGELAVGAVTLEPASFDGGDEEETYDQTGATNRDLTMLSATSDTNTTPTNSSHRSVHAEAIRLQKKKNKTRMPNSWYESKTEVPAICRNEK